MNALPNNIGGRVYVRSRAARLLAVYRFFLSGGGQTNEGVGGVLAGTGVKKKAGAAPHRGDTRGSLTDQGKAVKKPDNHARLPVTMPIVVMPRPPAMPIPVLPAMPADNQGRRNDNRCSHNRLISNNSGRRRRRRINRSRRDINRCRQRQVDPNTDSRIGELRDAEDSCPETEAD